MKTITNIKRKMVVGSRWHTHWKCREESKDMGVRCVSIIQSNSFAFRNPITGNDSWCDWPKRNEVVFNDSHPTFSFTIFHGDIELTYSFISEAV